MGFSCYWAGASDQNHEAIGTGEVKSIINSVDASQSVRHKRSLQKQRERSQRKIAKQLILQNSFVDRTMCENVSRTSRTDILAKIANVTSPGEAVNVGDVPDIEKGEVLVDSRGRGSFQKA